MTIKLNDAVIFESELSSSMSEPVKLNKKQLGNDNVLEFSVSSVGIKFWTTNEYSFDNVKVIGDITDTSKQESNNIFLLGSSEYASMDKAILKFIPYCSNIKNSIGTLDIFINNKKLFSSIPVCDNPYKQPVAKTLLNEGENTIVFKTNKGSYSVEQIKVALEFKEPRTKTYFFEINRSLFRSIREQGNDVIADIKFVDDQKEKRLKLDVNGHQETIETTKASFSKDISSRISEGNNYLRIEPFEDLEVVELKVQVI